MIKAVFFDFDGVLTKDEWEVTTTSRYISEKLGLDLEETCELYKDSADVWKVYSGEITEDQSWKGFYEKLKSANLISMGYNEFKAMRKEAFKSTQLDDKMVDLVKKIKSGGYFVGLITDNCKERIQAISEVYGFDDLFDVVVVSEEEKAIKRQGKPFETALKKVRVDAQETVFVDNDPNNLLIAVEFGYKTIHFDHEKRDYSSLCVALSENGIEL